MRFATKGSLLPTLALLLLVDGPAFGQTTWYVDASGSPPGSGTQLDPFTSLQFAIAHPTTVDGDTLLVLPGVYSETVDFLGKAVTVRSTAGAGVTAINARQKGSAVSFVSGETASVLDGFTILGGTGTLWDGSLSGGGIFLVDSDPLLRNLIVMGNTAKLGAGVYCQYAFPVFADCTIRDNVAEAAPAAKDGHGGGLYTVGGGPTLNKSLVLDNRAGHGGGAYALDSGLYMLESEVTGNQTTYEDFAGVVGQGGGICSTGSSFVSLWSSFVSENSTEGYDSMGGGLKLGSDALVHGCTILDNEAGDFFVPGWGGGIHGDVAVTVTDCNIEGNSAGYGGGGVFGSGDYSNCVIQKNSGQLGAGVCAGTSLTVRDSVITENRFLAIDPGYGGGVFGEALLERCEISENAADFGGGVHGGYESAAVIVDCDLWGNTVFPTYFMGPAEGGGAYGATLIGCRLFDNLAAGYEGCTGGGATQSILEDCEVFDNTVRSEQGARGGGVSDSSLLRCLVYGNAAIGNPSWPGGGGGAYHSDLDHCTVYGNTATQAGDGLYYPAGGTLVDSIVWGNGVEEIWGSPAVSNCDVYGGHAGVNNIDADPLFWDPENGDFHLKPGSPCIGAGTAGSDMGALPFDPAYCGEPSTYCAAKTNSLGCVPFIGLAGAPTLGGADDFTVTAASVLNNKPGLLLWSLAPAATSFGGGTLCLAAPIRRTPAQFSGGNPPPDDCSGAYSFHFSQALMSANGLALGDTVFAQYWSRDPGFASPDDVGLTDGLRFTLCP